MELKPIKPREALNKAFLKVKPNRVEIEKFKTNLIQLLDLTKANETESEEFHKNLVSDFLKKTYYDPTNFINTKGRNDLVIHNGDKPQSSVGIIIEAKKPGNKSEMLTKEKLNTKAFQELVLYYLRERITQGNVELKYLVATNINEWFIFDAHLFEKLFAQNKELVRKFNEFEAKRMGGLTTEFFYKEIAQPFVAAIQQQIEFTHFDIRDYEKPLRNSDSEDDRKLIGLFKLLSPEHLLKKAFANDSNSLDKRFYSELLHIIGLVETKDGGKKLIGRNAVGERQSGSLLENAIIEMDGMDKLSRLKNAAQFGATKDEKLFNVALQLSITWVNRILFLKLLEAQMVTYHKGETSYKFLSIDRIKGYDDLNRLFFQVLAKRKEERNAMVREAFDKVPYLNSSLFEATDLEYDILDISGLNSDNPMPVFSGTVLKDDRGRKLTGQMGTLAYFFAFLEAYDFSSEGAEEIQEDNKTLINASVLGLIFEKINGYKDGSFFTPGFITMYMCRETLHRAVVQKFNTAKGWECATLVDVHNKIGDLKEANAIVNSLRICDPAVGSGHFLVSALNEIIAIKKELGILVDAQGKVLRGYDVEVVNDELTVTDEDHHLFEYNPKNKDSQRVQETLFHEKQTIIENCLFGVDINPNSVKICRLRLWIELLKNAYYGSNGELETLPNIDINIKCGNSLISRFALDADLGKALKKSKWTISSYRLAVDTYRNAKSKDEKRSMEELIAGIKGDFRSEITQNDPKVKRLYKVSGELTTLSTQTQLFDMSKGEKAAFNKKVAELAAESKILEAEIEEIKSNKIYENAFEWRFEFPEVLNDEGDFVGFDVVIGNPPYIFSRELISESEKVYFNREYKLTQFKINTYVLFSELGSNIIIKNGMLSLIIPNNWLTLQNNSQYREFILNNFEDIVVVNDKNKTFEDASVDASIILLAKYGIETFRAFELNGNSFSLVSEVSSKSYLNNKGSIINYHLYKNSSLGLLINKINSSSTELNMFFDVNNGVQAYTVGEGTPIQTVEMKEQRVYHSLHQFDENWKMYCDGSDISRYNFKWSGQYIKYGKNLTRRRIPELFTGERIFVRQIPASMPYAIVSSFINIDVVCDNNYMILRPKSISHITLKQLSGLLNSKLISFWFYATFAKHQRKLFPQFKVKELEIFPIPNIINKLIGEKIETLVDQILTKKVEDHSANTTVLETQIDQLIYQLYGLSEEEIGIVENA